MDERKLAASPFHFRYTWRYLHQGGRWTAGDRLYHFGHRKLDPISGRWTTDDPAGYMDGLNLQEYVGSNPVSRSDPSGLQAWYEGWGRTAAYAIGFGPEGAAGEVWSGFGEGAKGGGSIVANTFSFGLTDYLGWTESWQYQGGAYEWSRLFANVSMLALGGAGGMALSATRAGLVLGNTFRGCYAFNGAAGFSTATRVAGAVGFAAMRGGLAYGSVSAVRAGAQGIASGWEMYQGGDTGGIARMLNGGLNMAVGAVGLKAASRRVGICFAAGTEVLVVVPDESAESRAAEGCLPPSPPDPTDHRPLYLLGSVACFAVGVQWWLWRQRRSRRANAGADSGMRPAWYVPGLAESLETSMGFTAVL